MSRIRSSKCYWLALTVSVSDDHLLLFCSKCHLPVLHFPLCSITVSSHVRSSRSRSLPSLVEQRVVGHIQILDLHLVIVHTHGGQSTGHLLLGRQGDGYGRKSASLLPPCGHIRNISWSEHRPTFTSSHSSLSSVKTREV